MGHLIRMEHLGAAELGCLPEVQVQADRIDVVGNSAAEETSCCSLAAVVVEGVPKIVIRSAEV
jgi:hypothetical protein